MIAIMTPTGAPLYSNLTKNNIGLDSSCVLLKKNTNGVSRFKTHSREDNVGSNGNRLYGQGCTDVSEIT